MFGKFVSELRRLAWRQRCCFMALALATSPLTATSHAVEGNWQALFDGTSLDGWKPSQDNKQFELVDGVILGSSSGHTTFLYTESDDVARAGSDSARSDLYAASFSA